MTEREIKLTIDDEVFRYIQSLPGTESEALERLVRREMALEAERSERLRRYRRSVVVLDTSFCAVAR